MGLMAALFAPSARSLENPQTSLSNPNEWLYDALGGGASSSGIRVNRKTALTCAAFWRAINLRADTVAKVPIHVYRRITVDGTDGKERDPKHQAYSLLRYKANEHMTASVFKKTLMGHRDLKGNGYAWIKRDGAARPIGLYPLDPEKTWPVRVNGVLAYMTTDANGAQQAIRAADVFHLRGLGWDGLVGYPVLEYARDSMGLGIGLMQYQSRTFRNGIRPSVSIEFPAGVKLSDSAAETLRTSIERLYAGIENTGRAIVLRDGAALKPFSMSAKDAQMIESAKMNVKDVANWTGTPPHKLGDDTRNAYNSLEQENQSYLDDTMDPIFVDWEEECRDKLFTEEQKRADSHVVEFLREALVRADLAARGAYLEKSIGGPWMTADEGRRTGNLNPLPDGQGAKLYPPKGTALPGDTSNEAEPKGKEAMPPAKPAGQDDEDEQKAKRRDAAHRAIIRDAVNRVVKRVGSRARRLSKTSEKFPDFLEGLSGEPLEFAREILMAPMAARFVDDDVIARTMRHTYAAKTIDVVRQRLDNVYSTTTESKFLAAIDAEMERLEATLPGEIADEVIHGSRGGAEDAERFDSVVPPP